MTTKINEIAVWQPDRVLTEADAQRLTVYLTAKAERDIAAERKAGSRYPRQGTPAYEACVAELAYRYATNWVGAGEASKLQITDWMEREKLYLHHPRQWETLEQMLCDIAEGSVSSSGKSIYGRIASDVLPYLREHEIADAVDIMGVLMEPEGGKGKLYHALPYLQAAIQHGRVTAVQNIIEDVKDRSVTRSDMLARLRGDDIILPAPATLTRNSDTWTLTVVMSEPQKQLILSRLGDRIRME